MCAILFSLLLILYMTHRTKKGKVVLDEAEKKVLLLLDE